MSKKMLNLTKNLKPMLLTTSKNILTFLCQSVLKTSVSVSALYHAGNHSITLIMVIYLSVVQVTTLPMNRKKLPILNVNYAMSKMLWMSKKKLSAFWAKTDNGYLYRSRFQDGICCF